MLRSSFATVLGLTIGFFLMCPNSKALAQEPSTTKPDPLRLIPGYSLMKTVKEGQMPTAELIPGYGLTKYMQELASPPQATPPQAAPKVEVLKVVLDPKIKEVEGAHEELNVVPGVKRKLRRSRTIECSISELRRLSVEASVKFDFPVVSIAVRGRVETELGKTVRASETVEEEFEIDGDKVQKVTLVWCDQYRTGVATVRVNGAVQEVSFEFRIGTKLDIRSSK